jgi:TatD DNase family protein
MPYLLTDTHAHLNDPHFAGRVGAVLTRARAAGVGGAVVPGWDEASSREALALAAAFPPILPAVGLHPWMVAEDTELAWLPALLDDPRVVAVGEIGLDGAVAVPMDHQLTAFRMQLALARARDLPVLIHCRKAWEPLLTCLHEVSGRRGVLHAFSGSVETMRLCVDLGYHIAFGGGLTRPNNRRARAVAAAVPANRLLLETDAPAIALEGIPKEAVEPAHIVRVLAALAALRGEEVAGLGARIAENTVLLFG